MEEGEIEYDDDDNCESLEEGEIEEELEKTDI